MTTKRELHPEPLGTWKLDPSPRRETWRMDIGTPRTLTIWVEKTSDGAWQAERGCMFISMHETMEEARRAAEEAARRYLARTAKKVRVGRHEWTREEFIDYLRETLIPDLRESGRDATADDFQTAIEFMEER